ncbi:GNAT family N-acetyltransferase [Clostridium estertheticum]|uniref:GNAT family N-acetyltransferase n=1 Tax=Clostridium estertheticum TaxID=238834 RepID=UPI0013E977B2|nr:GNAT family N-acetyltransferase [Clostridium estertheticum]MBZ9687072.1 GNAT family N-acetyltransferase [Clostridium estertheticum]
MIVNFDDKYTDGIIKLWNTVAVKDGYVELNHKNFESFFTNNPYFKSENTFILHRDGIDGFACGCTGDDLPLGDTSGYITCIILSTEAQTLSNFLNLTNALEISFKKQGKKQSEVLFFNPMMLPWYIPNTQKHQHNNAPGAPIDGYFYKFLLEAGYMERTRECAMYMNLKEFKLPEDILKKERKLLDLNYEVNLFDSDRHFGVKEMLKGLNNPLWKQEVSNCTGNGIPIIIAAKNREVVGFAGPVIRQETGRGYFAGIGVQKEHEGHGLGSVLFFKLCEALKNINAEYMSLYTGLSNPAIKIYKKAGFIPVREFAVMRKEL